MKTNGDEEDDNFHYVLYEDSIKLAVEVLSTVDDIVFEALQSVLIPNTDIPNTSDITELEILYFDRHYPNLTDEEEEPVAKKQKTLISAII